MNQAKDKSPSWLRYANLSTDYERRARFLPGVLTFSFLALPAIAFHQNINGWIAILIGGTGAGAILAVGISHLASAAGNRLQKQLWPRWPHDSPTNQWLHPNNTHCSMQRKKLWYAAIDKITGLKIDESQQQDHRIEAIINDAVTSVRIKLRSFDKTGLLEAHNIDYGFARNFTGLRFLWLMFSLIACAASWINFYLDKDSLLIAFFESVIMILAFYLAYYLLPEYVRTKAGRYSESFYGALEALDEQTFEK